mmetsp:Transcript_70931/g.196356  ORF Transcript_70931/g.196356 Transcript_70931/m.196356 type:complete len:393 (-) Transcript_70931:35-1213(-)
MHARRRPCARRSTRPAAWRRLIIAPHRIASHRTRCTRGHRGGRGSSEYDRVQHGAQALHDVLRHELAHARLQALLGVDLAHIGHIELLKRLLLLLHHALVVALRQARDVLHARRVGLGVLLEGLERQRARPQLAVQVHQHLLLQLVLAVCNVERVVVAVEAVDERLDGGLVQVPDVARVLPRLLAHHDQLRVDAAEGVNDHLALDALDRVHHHRHRPVRQLLEALLRAHVHAAEPAPEAGVGVVPAHHHLLAARLAQHVNHLLLEHRVHRLHAHARAALRHREHVRAAHCVGVHKLAQHQAHDLHRHARAAVLQHLEQGHGGDLHRLRTVNHRRIWRRCPRPTGPHAGEHLLDAVHGGRTAVPSLPAPTPRRALCAKRSDSAGPRPPCSQCV